MTRHAIASALLKGAEDGGLSHGQLKAVVLPVVKAYAGHRKGYLQRRERMLATFVAYVRKSKVYA